MTNALVQVTKGGNPAAFDVNQLIQLLNGLIDAGLIQFSGPVSVPASAPTATLNGSGNLTGSYGYVETFITGTKTDSGTVTVSGETTQSPVSASVTASGQQVSLSSLVTASAPVIGRRIYRNKSSGSATTGPFYLLTEIDDITTTTFLDNIPDSSLGAQVPSANTTGTGFADTTVNRTSDATVSNNFPSHKWQFQRSYWNGSNAITGTSYFVYDASGTLHLYNESASNIFSVDQSGGVHVVQHIWATSTDMRLIPEPNGDIGVSNNDGSFWGLKIQDRGAGNKPAVTTANNTVDDGNNGNMTVSGVITANGGLTVPSSQTVAFGVGNAVGQFFTASNPNGVGGGFIEWNPASGMPKVVAFTGAGASALDEFHISTQGLYIDAPINSIAGGISGTLYWVMDLRGSVKRVVISLASFDNTSDQQFTLPVAFGKAATMISTVNASMTIKTYNNGTLVTTYTNVQNEYEPLPGPFNAISIQVGTANGTIIIEGM